MIIIYAIALLCIFIDQLTKLIIMNNLPLGDSIEVIKDFFYITYIKNDGVAFGFSFTDKPWLNLTIQLLIAAVCLALFIFFSIKYKDFKKNKWVGISLGLLIGGLIGNVIDRVFYSTHSVTDFLSFILYYPWIEGGKFIINSFPFAVFNIADACLNVGVIMIIIFLLFIEPIKEKRNKPKDGDRPQDEDIVVNTKG